MKRKGGWAKEREALRTGSREREEYVAHASSSRCGYAYINLGHVRLEELVEPAEKLEPPEGPRLDLNQAHRCRERRR